MLLQWRLKNMFQNNLKMVFRISSHWPNLIPLFVLGSYMVLGVWQLFTFCVGMLFHCTFVLWSHQYVCIISVFWFSGQWQEQSQFPPGIYLSIIETVEWQSQEQRLGSILSSIQLRAKILRKTVKFWSLLFCICYRILISTDFKNQKICPSSFEQPADTQKKMGDMECMVEYRPWEPFLNLSAGDWRSAHSTHTHKIKCHLC